MSQRKRKLQELLVDFDKYQADIEPLSHSRSGSVMKMGISLSEISKEIDDARYLKSRIIEGEQVISVDSEIIDPSFMSDRLIHEDEDFLLLKSSIAENGQQVPILLRPNPNDTGRYQVIYGHRRLRALHSLGLPVKAIVKAMSDEELVICQGKENSERRNLSFIEKALFSDALRAKNFDRGLILQALSIDKSELSRMLQVVELLPRAVILAIGPALKVGRTRWILLAKKMQIETNLQLASELIETQEFKTLSSNKRFERIMGSIQDRNEPEWKNCLKNKDKLEVIRLKSSDNLTELRILRKRAEGFSEFLVNRLPELYSEYLDKEKNNMR